MVHNITFLKSIHTLELRKKETYDIKDFRLLPSVGVLLTGEHSKFTGEHLYESAILLNLLCSFIEITFWHECSPVNLLDIFRTPIAESTYEGLLINSFIGDFQGL